MPKHCVCHAFLVMQDQGRFNYVTPTSYLELITSFKTLLEAKRAQVWAGLLCK